MAVTERQESQEPPKNFPDTPPPQQLDYSFTLQAVMELQKSTGAFGEAIGQLRKSVEDQGKKLDRIRDTIRFAAGVVATLLSIGGFLLYALRGSILELIRSMP